MPSEREEDLARPTIFVGTLARGEISIPIRFQLHFGKDDEPGASCAGFNESLSLAYSHSSRGNSDSPSAPPAPSGSGRSPCAAKSGLLNEGDNKWRLSA